MLYPLSYERKASSANCTALVTQNQRRSDQRLETPNVTDEVQDGFAECPSQH